MTRLFQGLEGHAAKWLVPSAIHLDQLMLYALSSNSLIESTSLSLSLSLSLYARRFSRPLFKRPISNEMLIFEGLGAATLKGSPRKSRLALRISHIFPDFRIR